MKKHEYQKYLCFIYSLLVFCLLFGCEQQKATQEKSYRSDEEVIQQAFLNRQSNLWVESTGIVEKILSDDLNPPRHQRFIIRLNHGQTLLISHNIDIAPRIHHLKGGDRIYFRGEYEWNDKGGVVHWTHHDPEYRHSGGWIEYRGQSYR